jgi:hypothetical protein
MKKSSLSEDLQCWEQEFRTEAKADKLAVLREHLRGLELRAKPGLVLEGTIQVVQACLAYMKMDGQSYTRFLAMQTYDPFRSLNAAYAFTFSLFDKAFARVLVARDLRGLDLADLYGHPWQPYKLCGYDRFWIMRADRTDLTKRDCVKLERLVTDDLRYDYSEEELDFSFEGVWLDNSQLWALLVRVQDSEEVMKANMARQTK